MIVQSHKGLYRVFFMDGDIASMFVQPTMNAHFLIDEAVAELYATELSSVLGSGSVLRIKATEQNKSLAEIGRYVEHLVARRVRRGDRLVALGGGVIQDITCFLAATLLRGMAWRFYPTTLLAQADSCIGSKSSINVGSAKNILGTFTPPSEIVVNLRFLDTLEARDVRSGVGEMLKVHIIDGPESFDQIANDYRALLNDKAMMLRYIRRSLEIKKGIIEQDEFDLGIRRIMNYGHTFGHAIESATAYAIPHGIAVTLGMDMANFSALRMGLLSEAHYQRMRRTLAANFAGFEDYPISPEAFFSAISKDKKNTQNELGLILLDQSARVCQRLVPNDEVFRKICREYLKA